MVSFEPVFDHIHLRSLDPEAAAQFYVDHLGARIDDRIETEKVFRIAIKIGELNVFIDRVPARHDALRAPAPSRTRAFRPQGEVICTRSRPS